MELALGIVMIVLSVALTLMVLFQSAQDKQLSGTIAGGAETFFGKNKASSMDAMLSRLTVIFSIILVVTTIALNLIG